VLPAAAQASQTGADISKQGRHAANAPTSFKQSRHAVSTPSFKQSKHTGRTPTPVQQGRSKVTHAAKASLAPLLLWSRCRPRTQQAHHSTCYCGPGAGRARSKHTTAPTTVVQVQAAHAASTPQHLLLRPTCRALGMWQFRPSWATASGGGVAARDAT